MVPDMRPSATREGSPMQDILMLIFTLIFFAVALLYVRACEKLR